MKSAGLIAGAILFCAATAAVHAQTAKPELQPLDFNTLDTNRDGKLSQREAQHMPTTPGR